LVASHADTACTTALAEKPDVLLLGVGSAGLDGWDLARRLSAEPSLHGLQVIALADEHAEGDHERAAAVGIRWLFVKPVQPELLRGVLQTCGLHGGRREA
jgi:DNA-binding response OmpR family regulator